MIIIREVLVAKPGQASKLAKMMKGAMAGLGDGETRIMTDLTGQFNRVIMETKMESVAEFEKRMKEYSQSQEMKQKMSGYTDMYLTGEREVYTVVE